MKGIFIIVLPLEHIHKNVTGMYKKVMMQVEELGKYFDVEIAECAYKTNLFKKVWSRMPLTPNNFKWPVNKPFPDDVDFVYFRMDECDWEIIRFLKKLKKRNPSCKVIVEFPNYPLDYDAMIKNISMIPTKYKHFHSIKYVDRYTDRFVTFGRMAVKSSVPTIRIHNMLDYSKERPRELHDSGNTINVISVSGMMKWHRIDRLLSGMKEYYSQAQSRDFVLHLVGTGSQCAYYLKLAEEYGLSDKVMYYGVQEGEELNKIYDKCDLGIEVLSEKGIFSSSLKSREYWGKGLPIITTSYFEPRTKQIEKYIYTAELGDGPIDIKGIIDYYDQIYSNGNSDAKKKVADEIRRFAVETYDIKTVFKPVIDFINSEEENVV